MPETSERFSPIGDARLFETSVKTIPRDQLVEYIRADEALRSRYLNR